MPAASSTIAIVGGGAGGALVAAQLLKQSVQPLRVLIYETSPFLGRGLAYGTDDVAHLLNVPAGKISAIAEEPRHFLQWLNAPSNCASLFGKDSFGETDFVPRAFYGRYLTSVLEDAERESRLLGAHLVHRREKVVDFISHGSTGTIVTSSADTEDVQHVVLALGNLPPRNPLARTHEFFQSKKYVPFVWTQGALEAVPLDEDLLVVGSGLTAVDVIATLLRRGHRGKITITSRNGRLPHVHEMHPPYMDFLKGRAFPSDCRSWFKLFREELCRSEKVGANWRPVFDALRPHTQKIWQGLSLSERQRFLRHIRSLWECHRHRVPPEAWQPLRDGLQSGAIRFIPGRIQDFQEHRRHVDVLLRPKGKTEQLTLKVSRVLNCIGPESNFRNHLNDPLLVNLIARGALCPDPLYLGLEATPSGEAISLDGIGSHQLSLLGPPLRGVLWETTAIPEIRVQAASLASRILSDLPQTTWHI